MSEGLISFADLDLVDIAQTEESEELISLADLDLDLDALETWSDTFYPCKLFARFSQKHPLQTTLSDRRLVVWSNVSEGEEKGGSKGRDRLQRYCRI